MTGEIQIKTTLIPYLTGVKMTVIKKTSDRHGQGSGQKRSLPHYWDDNKPVLLPWSSVWPGPVWVPTKRTPSQHITEILEHALQQCPQQLNHRNSLADHQKDG